MRGLPGGQIIKVGYTKPISLGTCCKDKERQHPNKLQLLSHFNNSDSLQFVTLYNCSIMKHTSKLTYYF